MAVIVCNDRTVIDWCLYAGDKNRKVLQVLADGDPMNLTGATVTAMARAKASDPDPAALTATVTAVDETTGVYAVAWDGEEVRTLLGSNDFWEGVWDLNVLESGETLPFTPAKGKITAEWDVTR